MEQSMNWLQKTANFLTYNTWEMINIVSAVLYALAGVCFEFSEKQLWFLSVGCWGWILLIIAFILSVFGCIKLSKKNSQILNLKSLLNDSSQKIQLLEATLEKYGEDNYSLFQYVLAGIFKSLSLNGTDRVSLYKKEKENLVLMGRYSINPDYNKVTKRVYPISEGYIGKAMKDGSFFIDNIPEFKDGKREEYYSFVCNSCNIQKDIVRNLSMKSRTYYCKALTDSMETERKAVIVFESLEANRFTEEQVKGVLEPEEKKLTAFIEKLRFRVPDTDYANKEGF